MHIIYISNKNIIVIFLIEDYKMYHNTEADWKSFEYIFSGWIQYTSEYLVMTSIKIFRYLNQAGIEIETIEFCNEVIGFQAKYCDASRMIADWFSELKIIVYKPNGRILHWLKTSHFNTIYYLEEMVLGFSYERRFFEHS